MLHLYIYYKVRATDRDRLAAQVRGMQALLADGGAALRRRIDNDEETETWMEIYENVGPDFDARLEDAVAKARLTESIAGPRHVERFVDFDV